MRYRVRRAIRCLPIAVAVCLLVLRPETAASAAKEGVTQCLEAVLPSLFPFFVLSRLLLNGESKGTCSLVSRLFGRVFSVPEAALPVFLMGLVSGFPVGASAAAELYRQGGCTKEEAERLLVFCNNCGPGFLFGAVSLRLYGGVKSALWLFVLQCLISVWLGALLGAGKVPSRREAQTSEAQRPLSFSHALPAAVLSGGRSALIVCAYVVFFAALTAFLPKVPLLRGMMELTGGILCLPKTASALPAAAFLTGFGGLAVACQVLASLEWTDLRGRLYIPFRLLHGSVMAVTVLMWQHLPILLPVWALLLAFSAFYVGKGRKQREIALY